LLFESYLSLDLQYGESFSLFFFQELGQELLHRDLPLDPGHFVAGQPVSVYAEGAAGHVEFDEDVPETPAVEGHVAHLELLVLNGGLREDELGVHILAGYSS